MLDFDIDGVVFKVDSKAVQQSLGYRNKSPKWATAFKFPPESQTTIVLNIENSVGRSGAITPVAKLKPVRVGGVVVSSASLHNYNELKRLDVRIGDNVVIHRAGDVIPQIVSVDTSCRVEPSEPFTIPSNCPSCNSIVEQIDAILYCTGGFSCPSQCLESIVHFASREAFDIQNLSTKTIERLIQVSLIKKPEDIFKLTVEDLITLDGFGATSSKKLIQAINKSKYISLARFIYAFGIPGVGEVTSNLLSRKYIHLEDLLSSNLKDLKDIPGIGESTAHSIYNFIRNQTFLNTIKEMMVAGVEIQQPKKEDSSPLHGTETPKKSTLETPKEPNLGPTLELKTNLGSTLDAAKKSTLDGMIFVITGTLSSPRANIVNKITNLGGKISNSVSKKTNYVVLGANPGSKYTQAKKLGTTILSEEEFDVLIQHV
jgi:DNA ligase (NAD+)